MVRLLDPDERDAALSKAGDPLERLSAVVDFAIFRPDPDATPNRSDGSKGGRPPIDPVRIFMALAVRALYGLSDARADFRIMDRRGVGRIVDASIVAAKHSTDAGRDTVKGGGIPEDWRTKPAKLARKDRDARWTPKRGRRKRRPDGSMMEAIATPVFGYGSPINIDQRHGLIRTWPATDAVRNDGRELAGHLDRTNAASVVWADTADRSRKKETHAAKAGLVPKIHFRCAPGTPPKPPHQRANAARSKVRSAVEHPFAEQKGRRGSSWGQSAYRGRR